MKILHLCLACFYIDGFAYQENILPKYHKKLGNEVEIIASTQTYIDNVKIGYLTPSSYINEDGIKVVRIPYKTFGLQKFKDKLRIYAGLREKIEEFEPEIIFLHDIQFISIIDVIRYKKEHPKTVLLADCHADEYNSAKSFFSRNLLHKGVYKFFIRRAEPYIEKFYGTLPCRCDFLHNMYDIPENKIEYLPFGADDDFVKMTTTSESRNATRSKYGITNDEFVLITGGKINNGKKNILLLMDAVKTLELPVRLVIFGSVDDDIKLEFDKKLECKRIIYTGWADVIQSYLLMGAADVAIFPCLHSTLWEQAAGLGLPCVVHYIEGYTHINKNGNCYNLENVSLESLISAIKQIQECFSVFKQRAEECKAFFSYKHIAELTSKKWTCSDNQN